jgi:multiple sugar transport system ATP-binding protein
MELAFDTSKIVIFDADTGANLMIPPAGSPEPSASSPEPEAASAPSSPAQVSEQTPAE